MVFQVFDTLTREKRPFEPLAAAGRVVRMYNCGPTVYGRVHIGNLRSFLFADTLRRWLESSGYEVQQVMNITDVGHIQGDADQGEDKLEAQARRERRDPWEISRHFTQLFFQDLEALGCRPARVNPRASEHIPEMLEIIEGLLEKGYAYQVDGNVYFEVQKFPRYGRLSGNRVEDLEAGARIEVREEKRHPADFALWKNDPLHLMKWASRFGPDGFPGWHIECSAMARKHLGEQLDIHTGGEDNVFPHHECEIAQSEAFTGQPFARYWMHAKFLLVDGGKMSKSLGNVYTVDDVRERGFSPRALRFTLVRGHYRGPLNFTWGILNESEVALRKLDDLVDRVEQAQRSEAAACPEPAAGQAALAAAERKFRGSMDDDLNVPAALSALFELRNSVLELQLAPAVAREAFVFLRWALDDVLGLPRDLSEKEAIEDLIRRRRQARESKDWSEADRVRDELSARKVTIQDEADGTRYQSPGPSGIVPR